MEARIMIKDPKTDITINRRDPNGSEQTEHRRRPFHSDFYTSPVGYLVRIEGLKNA